MKHIYLLCTFSIGFILTPAKKREFNGPNVTINNPVVSEAHVTSDTTIIIDGNDEGRTFDGIGALSAGASSRLLYDYPEPERSQILDYLFKPKYGASMQILKVEIGGDMNSTDGSEASHMRNPGEVNCNRGYEWWLMKEAKKRNPDITLAALQWGAPGWIEEFWSEKNIEYNLAWLECAESHGLTIDYMGGWNERGWDADWYIAWDKALEEHYPDVGIIAADDVHNPWSIATEMTKNPALKQAVDIVGDHSPCRWRTQYKKCTSSEDAQSLGKPLWLGEHSSMGSDAGAIPLARAMNRLYIQARITGNIAWSLISAWYGNLPIANTGLMLAQWPWSGYYHVGKSIWVYAHTAQFAEPGWTYINDASGFLKSGASFVTLKSPDKSDYTTVIETMDAKVNQTVTFSVRGGLPAEKQVHVWTTNLRSDRSEDYFVHTKSITPEDGTFDITVQPGYLYTLSTTTGQQKGDAGPEAGIAEMMELPYQEDFEGYGEGKLARYYSDINGSFETEPCLGEREGMCYGQVTFGQPIVWNNKGYMRPATVMGDPGWWGDYQVSTDVLLEQPGHAELIGRVAVQADTIVAGYHLQVNSEGRWELYRRTLNKEDVTLESGEISFGTGEWLRIGLKMRGRNIGVLMDGKQVASVTDTYYTAGQIGLVVSRWKHAQFDNVAITPTGDWPQFIPHENMSVTATSEHPDFHRGYVFPVEYAIDDRLETAWHSEWMPEKAPLPQSITLDLGRSYSIRGLTYRPNLIHHAPGGNITGYNIYLSSDGETFEKVAGGEWPGTRATKLVSWPRQETRYIRLEGVKGVRDMVSAGEINIVREYSALPLEE